jgi:hypothetical protein
MVTILMRATLGLTAALLLILRKLATGAPPELSDEAGPEDPATSPSAAESAPEEAIA